jgi:hypothetical protein
MPPTVSFRQAGVLAYRRYLDQAVTNRGWTDTQAPPAALRNAAARRLPAKVLKEVRGCLDYLRQAAEENLVAGIHECAGNTANAHGRKEYIQQMLDRLDRDVDIERSVDQLKSRFGALPDEPELRKKLEEAQNRYHERLRKMLEQSQ